VLDVLLKNACLLDNKKGFYYPKQLTKLYKSGLIKALDNEDVDTLFFIFPKSETRFLRIQAKFLRLLKDEEALSAIRKVSPVELLFEVFSGKEAGTFNKGVQ